MCIPDVAKGKVGTDHWDCWVPVDLRCKVPQENSCTGEKALVKA